MARLDIGLMQHKTISSCKSCFQSSVNGSLRFHGRALQFREGVSLRGHSARRRTSIRPLAGLLGRKTPGKNQAFALIPAAVTPAPPLTRGKWNLTAGAIAVITYLALLATRRGRQEERARKLALMTEGDPLNSREYLMARARTRQAVHAHKAVEFMKNSSQTRAMVELERAMAENDLCRAPLLVGRYDKQEMLGLYRLYLQMTELPPEFSSLLQLREMLAIEDEAAQGLEIEVIGSRNAFSI